MGGSFQFNTKNKRKKKPIALVKTIINCVLEY